MSDCPQLNIYEEMASTVGEKLWDAISFFVDKKQDKCYATFNN